MNEQPRRIGYDHTAGHRLKEMVGSIGKWVPWWGMLSVTQTLMGAMTLYLTVYLRGIWWPIANTGSLYLTAILSLIFLLGPTVTVVLAVGRMDARNVALSEVQSAPLYRIPTRTLTTTEDGSFGRARKSVHRGARSAALVRPDAPADSTGIARKAA